MIKKVSMFGRDWEFRDEGNAKSVDLIAHELNQDCYGLSRVRLTPGDVIIDIGANVGMFSIPLAKMNPGVTIYAFEAFPPTFENLAFNCKHNGVQNVIPVGIGVSGDSKTLHMQCCLSDMTGGASAHFRQTDNPLITHVDVDTTTLDQIFSEKEVESCRLLKIDCEGSEHEILSGFHHWERVGFLAAEFHENDLLRQQGYTNKLLRELVLRHIPEQFTAITCIEMGC